MVLRLHQQTSLQELLLLELPLQEQRQVPALQQQEPR